MSGGGTSHAPREMHSTNVPGFESSLRGAGQPVDAFVFKSTRLVVYSSPQKGPTDKACMQVRGGGRDRTRGGEDENFNYTVGRGAGEGAKMFGKWNASLYL